MIDKQKARCFTLWLAFVIALSACVPEVSLASVAVSAKDQAAALARRLAPRGVSVVVLLFFATDCPVSDRYQPEVKRLSHLFEDRSVKFWMVYPNPMETRVGTEAHQKQFSQEIPPLLDPEQRLVKMAGARVTPEAAVFRVTAQGLDRVYRERIDDRYLSLGIQRPHALHFELLDAIEAALAGRPVRAAAGKAVGCSIIPVP